MCAATCRSAWTRARRSTSPPQSTRRRSPAASGACCWGAGAGQGRGRRAPARTLVWALGECDTGVGLGLSLLQAELGKKQLHIRRLSSASLLPATKSSLQEITTYPPPYVPPSLQVLPGHGQLGRAGWARRDPAGRVPGAQPPDLRLHSEPPAAHQLAHWAGGQDRQAAPAAQQPVGHDLPGRDAGGAGLRPGEEPGSDDVHLGRLRQQPRAGLPPGKAGRGCGRRGSMRCFPAG